MQLGSGTDPVEGGALAAVILEHLAPRVALCFSTSHHAELKDLPVGFRVAPGLQLQFQLLPCKDSPTTAMLWLKYLEC